MIVVRTPLRVSFAGGGTDFPEYFRQTPGTVVASSIDKYVTVVVSERFDEKLYVNYSKKEIVDDVDEVQHDLVREALYYAGVRAGVEITMLADIPSEGSGLGSSSSLTVALLHALYTYRGKAADPESLARDAYAIECLDLGRPGGYQDQYMAAYGGLRELQFGRHAIASLPIPLERAERQALSQELMLFFTGMTRQSGTILADQQTKVEANRPVLDRMAGEAQLLAARLRDGQRHTLGGCLSAGWERKRSLADGVTNPVLDALYQRAMEAGARGAKIAGAGGGGFLLAHVALARQEAVRTAVEQYLPARELPFSLSRFGSQVVYSHFE